MAKSLRSKSQRKMKSLKRQHIFGPVEEARLQRLAQKQQQVNDIEEDRRSEMMKDQMETNRKVLDQDERLSRSQSEQATDPSNKNKTSSTSMVSDEESQDSNMDMETKSDRPVSSLAKKKIYLSRRKYSKAVARQKKICHQEYIKSSRRQRSRF